MTSLLGAVSRDQSANVDTLWLIIIILVCYCIIAMIATACVMSKINIAKRKSSATVMSITPVTLVMFYQSLLLIILAVFSVVITYKLVSSIYQYRMMSATGSIEVVTDPVPLPPAVIDNVVPPVPLPTPIDEVVVATTSKVVPAFMSTNNKRYIVSFVAKLSQLPDQSKVFYSDVKNEIMSYRGIRSRVSWHYDSITYKRMPLVKFVVKGKTLNMYIALNPDIFVGTKYKVERVKTKKYAKTPSLFKIKNPRRAKYALELWQIFVQQYSLTRIDIEPIDYVKQYPKLIKAVKYGGVVAKKDSLSNFF